MSGLPDTPTLDQDSVEDASKPDLARRWLEIIQRSERVFQPWRERCRKIWKIYLDDRMDNERIGQKRKLNLLWSNVQTLQPAIYQKLPHAVVSRRFKDDDDLARTASELLERAIEYSFAEGRVDDTVRAIRDDYLVTGRGTAWVRYKAEIDTTQLDEGLPLEQIVSEKALVDYVHWSDFGHNIARTWDEVKSVWRKSYLTRKELVDKWGKKVGNAISLDYKAEAQENAVGDIQTRQDQATIYEIWDKTTKKVYWVAKAYDKVIEEAEPLLNFEGFFPCPKPAYATLSTGSLIPVPDYVFYQDQLEEIDDLTVRIGYLTDALKLVGFYPSGDSETSAAIEKALKPGFENALIGIPNWGQFKEGGGANGQIEWVPVEQVMKVIEGCINTRKQLIEDVYQITGISDIIRGESDPNETATAQNIKAQWGGVRVRDRQMELARFIRDIARLVGEVIAERFQPETLLQMTNMDLPTQAELDQQKALAQLQQMQQQQQQMLPPPQAAPPAPSQPQGAAPPAGGAPGPGVQTPPPQPPMGPMQ